MTRLPWLVLVLAFAGVLSGAETSEARLVERLATPEVLRGDFTQSRQITGFRRPVESSGQFVVARGQGLVWHTLKPFGSLLSITRDRLRMSSGGDAPVTTLDARREPLLRTTADLLQSVVVADIQALRSQFDMQVELAGADSWRLALVPKEPALRSRFSTIELAGARHVQSVRLVEMSGDVTTIRFENQREDTQLTVEEAGHLK